MNPVPRSLTTAAPPPLPPSRSPPARRFVVLVAGTVVYSRGDEREIATAIAGGAFDAEASEADEGGARPWPGAPGEGWEALLHRGFAYGSGCCAAGPPARGSMMGRGAARVSLTLDAPAAAAAAAASGPLPVGRAPATSSVPMNMAGSSLKSTMNMNFSLPSSLSRSLMRQRCGAGRAGRAGDGSGAWLLGYRPRGLTPAPRLCRISSPPPRLAAP